MEERNHAARCLGPGLWRPPSEDDEIGREIDRYEHWEEEGQRGDGLKGNHYCFH